MPEFIHKESMLFPSSQAKEAAKATLKRRDTSERFLSLPGFTDHGIPEVCKYIQQCAINIKYIKYFLA